MARVLKHLQRLKNGCLDALSSRFTRWTKPLRTSLPLATLTDLDRSKSELIAENALLRQQLIVLKRQVKRPTFTKTDRILLVLLAKLVEMVTNNRLWGAERIRGELLKLGIRVCKRTVQKYMRGVRRHQPRGQKWSTDLA